jgi:hypothetical protein
MGWLRVRVLSYGTGEPDAMRYHKFNSCVFPEQTGCWLPNRRATLARLHVQKARDAHRGKDV